MVDAPTVAERVEFVSRALHSPAVSTLERATKNGYFTSFPLVTTKQLRRFPPDQRATLMGHMCAQRSNLGPQKLHRRALPPVSSTKTIPHYPKIPKRCHGPSKFQASNRNTRLHLGHKLPRPTKETPQTDYVRKTGKRQTPVPTSCLRTAKKSRGKFTLTKRASS